MCSFIKQSKEFRFHTKFSQRFSPFNLYFEKKIHTGYWWFINLGCGQVKRLFISVQIKDSGGSDTSGKNVPDFPSLGITDLCTQHISHRLEKKNLCTFFTKKVIWKKDRCINIKSISFSLAFYIIIGVKRPCWWHRLHICYKFPNGTEALLKKVMEGNVLRSSLFHFQSW